MKSRKAIYQKLREQISLPSDKPNAALSNIGFMMAALADMSLAFGSGQLSAWDEETLLKACDDAGMVLLRALHMKSHSD